MIIYVLATLIGAGIVVADQLVKHYIAANYIMADQSKVFIPKLINIIYVENDGAAWGMLGGSTWLLLSLTIVIMLICVTLLLKYGVKDKFMFCSVMLIISGGLGNMIDRVFRGGKVIDFLQFDFWKNFPVFNIADCAIVIGGTMLVVYLAYGIIKESRQKNGGKTAAGAEQNDENS